MCVHLRTCFCCLTGFHENDVNIIQLEAELLERFSRKFVMKLILSEVELFYSFFFTKICMNLRQSEVELIFRLLRNLL